MTDLTAGEIMRRLPHRHPFVLVDRVRDLQPGVSATGCKSITVSDPVFAGHFPGEPIYPGVLVIEASAQVCGLILPGVGDASATAASATATGAAASATVTGAAASATVTGGARIAYLASVKRFRFRQLIRPGDTLELRCRAGVTVAALTEFAVTVSVGGRVVADGVLALAVGADPGAAAR